MNKYFIFAFILATFNFAPMRTFADSIVDTGTPTSIDGAVLSSSQWFAGEFSLNQQTKVNKIFGYFRTYSYGYGDLTLALYADGGDIPDVTNELFSSSIYISEPLGWYGVSGLDLELSEVIIGLLLKCVQDKLTLGMTSHIWHQSHLVIELNGMI